MSALRTLLSSAALVGWAFVVCTSAAAQQSSESLRWQDGSERAAWEQRALRRSRSRPQSFSDASFAQRSGQRSGVLQSSNPVRLAQHVPEDAETVPLPDEQLSMPALTGPGSPQAIPQTAPFSGQAYDPGIEDGPGGYGPGCGECDDGCGECGFYGFRHDCVVSMLRNVTLFAGVQGFKGPLDLNQNGNFGFHEGFNFSGPLGDPWGLGYQIGFQAVQSDFFGSSTVNNDGNGRDQLFFTAGLFHRAVCGGLQGGVVFDVMHDNFFDKADLRQIRSETSLVFDEWHEVGYFGSYGVSLDRLNLGDGTMQILKPNDLFAMFYRRHFTGGGQGRIWGGFTGMGEGLVGAEASVPLGTSWALENNFIFAIPDRGQQDREAWSVSMQLVWYPGRSAQCVFDNPFHQLFGVADNSNFLVRRAGTIQP